MYREERSKTLFHIGIQQPFADRNETIAAVSVDGLSIVSCPVFTNDILRRRMVPCIIIS